MMDPCLYTFIDKLEAEHTLYASEWQQLLDGYTPGLPHICLKNHDARGFNSTDMMSISGDFNLKFYKLLQNNCYYCGIRSGNTHVHRYRLTKEEILSCCETGYELGFRTFVLQGGEDPYYTTARLSDVVHTIRTTYPDCAITLSTGEATKEEYQQLFDAGANRFLLRHETYNTEHYQKLHPAQLSAAHRQQCLWDLKEIGYQVGTGFMVGSPWQTSEHLAEDLLFLKELNPQMVGIGPFIPHHDTPFAGQKAGTLELTLSFWDSSV
mgnify:CR=1 FL=1